jgi:hypothetical protein
MVACQRYSLTGDHDHEATAAQRCLGRDPAEALTQLHVEPLLEAECADEELRRLVLVAHRDSHGSQPHRERQLGPATRLSAGLDRAVILATGMSAALAASWQASKAAGGLIVTKPAI